MKTTALALILVMLAALVVVFPAPASAQARAGVGFYGRGNYGGWYGRGYYGGWYGPSFYAGVYGPWWPDWGPYYAAPAYYAPYYADPSANINSAPASPPPTQCYAPEVDQNGAVPMPDLSKPVPCPATQ